MPLALMPLRCNEVFGRAWQERTARVMLLSCALIQRRYFFNEAAERSASAARTRPEG